MTTHQLKYLSVDVLQSNPFQPRNKIQPAEIKELTQSIRQYGVLEPLVIAKTPAGFQIIAGERRWRAAKAAGLKEVPVIIRKTSPRGMLEMAIVENVQRIDLNAIERAKAFWQLIHSFHYSHNQIAQKIGKSTPFVSNSLRLLNLPDAIKDGIIGGQISEGHGRALASIDNKQVQIQLYKQILKESASVRRAEELTRYYKQKTQIGGNESSHQIENAVSPVVLKRWQAQIARYLKTNPQIKLTRSKNQTRLILTLKGDQAATREDLEKIISLITQDH